MSTDFDPVTYLRSQAGRRFILGIAGPPGVGKSTFASRLAQSLSGSAVVLPADGYHLLNADLDRLGRLNRKGAPDTYDVDAFLETLRRLKQGKSVMAPAYSRVLHAPVPEAIAIPASVSTVIVEGNYLLLGAAPWGEVRTLLDECWYLQADRRTIVGRLRERHTAVGRSLSEADLKIQNVDLPNGVLVATSAARADRIIDVG